jgi:hypothetical protein
LETPGAGEWNSALVAIRKQYNLSVIVERLQTNFILIPDAPQATIQKSYWTLGRIKGRGHAATVL